ncbi:substrate-binding periplasmic protein [Rheinheimera maricola]|uniref:Transporter substrate-binding domain-containing protein n=1 Tax=Rheinheimera maricola TaxID=2793282 RepID=A0ABS7X6Y9_9GAMM|nr:transporter substrate-binding domain-containing protein [Rheinheimera maricola]MBZ9611311.1 transporter substrate-binding domain-containing protein [Rheinheimera maricola]
MDSRNISRNRMRRWIVWHSYFLLLALVLMLLQVHAQILRVAVPTENYPPFYYQQNGTVSGFSIEVLQAVAAEMALTLEWHHLPWNRMMQEVANGKADTITIFYKNPARESQFHFSSESYYSEPLVLLCRAPCQLQYEGQLNNLQQHIIAVVRGYSYGTKLDQLDFQRAAVVDSDNMLIKQILNGRLEAGIMSSIVARHALAAELQADKIQLLSPVLDYADIYFAFSKQSVVVTPELIKQFDAALRRYKQSAAYTALLRHYKLDNP